MLWITTLLLFIQIPNIHGLFTGITLNPVSNVIKDTRLGNEDMSTVILDPVATAAVCYVKSALSAATGTTVDHPFNMRYQLLPASRDWYVIFDSTSIHQLNSAIIPIYIVTIECVENTVTQTADITIQVLPNQRPAIIDYPGTTRSFIASSVPKGTSLYKVTATDGDSDPLTYSYNVQPPVNYFTIDPVTQEIRTAVDFRSVTETFITITVDVSDGFDTVPGFKLQIQITNLNIRPQITNLPTSVTMKEDVGGGTFLIDLLYSDPDFTKTFVPNCTVFPNVSPSIITISGNRLSLATGSSGTSLLDYETTPNYQISCSIFDDYLYSPTGVLTLNVQNVNEKPKFNQDVYNCQLFESKASVSTCNLYLNAIDPENDAFTISIRPGNNNDRFTFVSPASDILSFAVDYDVDNGNMPGNVFVDIEARDSSGAAGLAQIKVTVADVNDNTPTFPASSLDIDIDDVTSIGIVSFLLAMDDDSGLNGNVEYKLIAISPITASNYISVLANGQIHYTKKFPGNLGGTTALLTIQAEDAGVPSKSSTTTRAVKFINTPTTTPIPPTTPQPIITTVQPTSATAQQNYFDEPANIVMVAILGLVVLVALIIALFFCMKKLLLGYCCKPRRGSGRIHPSPYNGYHDYYPSSYYTPPRPSRHYSEYSGPPQYYREPGEHTDPRVYRDPRYYNRDPRIPLSVGSVHGEFYDDRSAHRSKNSRLAVQPY